MIKNTCPDRNLCHRPSLFSSVSVSWDNFIASGWKCKAGATRGCRRHGDLADSAWKTGHSSLWSSPEGLTDLRWHTKGFVWKQTMECVQREREHIGKTVWSSRSLGVWIHWSSWRKGIHQRSYNVASSHTLPFTPLTTRALPNRLQTQGEGFTIWVMRYV